MNALDEITRRIEAIYEADVSAATAKRDRYLDALKCVRELEAAYRLSDSCPVSSPQIAAPPPKPRSFVPAGSSMLEKLRFAISALPQKRFSISDIKPLIPEVSTPNIITNGLRSLAAEGFIAVIFPGAGRRGTVYEVAGNSIPEAATAPAVGRYDAKPRYGDSDPSPINANVIGAGARIRQAEDLTGSAL